MRQLGYTKRRLREGDKRIHFYTRGEPPFEGIDDLPFR